MTVTNLNVVGDLSDLTKNGKNRARLKRLRSFYLMHSTPFPVSLLPCLIDLPPPTNVLQN